MDAVKPYTRVWSYSFSIICLLESPNYKKSESLVRSQVSTQGNFLFPLSANAELETLILPFPRGYWLPTLEEALIFSASVSVHVSARFPRNCWPKTADFIQFSCYLSLLWRRRRRAQLSVRSHLFSVCFFSQPVWTHIHFPGMGIIQINHYRVIVVCQQRAWMWVFSILSLSFAILISSEALYQQQLTLEYFIAIYTYPPAWEVIDAREALCAALFGLKNYAPSWGASQIQFNKLYPEYILALDAEI
jgi:hypothetical protein